MNRLPDNEYSGRALAEKINEIVDYLNEREKLGLTSEIKALKELNEQREKMNRQIVDTRKIAPWSESHVETTAKEGDVIKVYESGRILVKVEKGNEILSPEEYRRRYPDVAQAYFRASMGTDENQNTDREKRWDAAHNPEPEGSA